MSDKVDIEIEATEVEAPRRRKVTILANSNSVVTVMPTVQAVMNDALSVLSKEVSSLKRKSMRPNMELTRDESTKLVKYVKALVELSREERENEKLAKVDNLTNEELVELARQSIAQLEEK